MGLYDRDYYREPTSSGFGRLPGWSVTTWLLVLNIGVFLLDEILRPADSRNGPLTLAGYFSVQDAIFGLQVWRFFTFQFLHAGLGHLFANMLSLYFFGPVVETVLGSRRFIVFYLLCGIAGAACYLGLWEAHLLIVSPNTQMVGASAGIFGVLVAAAIVAPNMTITLLFPPIPMPMKVFALIMLGWSVVTVFQSGHNAGGEAAHIGGALAGWLMIKYPRCLNFAELGGGRRPRRARRTFQKDWSRDFNR